MAHEASGMLFDRSNPQLHGLGTCPACGQDFVHPVDWEPQGSDHWWMLLRCGNCGHLHHAVVSEAAAQDFDAKLDRDMRQIAVNIRRLHRQWRKAEIDAFAAALDHDLIAADDFAV
jgi:hypothetical protein